MQQTTLSTYADIIPDSTYADIIPDSTYADIIPDSTYADNIPTSNWWGGWLVRFGASTAHL